MFTVFYPSNSLVPVLTLILLGLVDAVPTSGDQETILQGFRDVAYLDYDNDGASSSNENSVRKERSADYTLNLFESRYRKKRSPSLQELEDLRYTVLDHINNYRDRNGLGHLELDDTLTDQSQAYANLQVQTFPRTVTFSCDPCTEYSEINLRRRSSKPLPKGGEGGDWIFESLYPSDEVDTSYDAVILEPENHKVGIGAGYATDSRKINYIYVVIRFARH